MRLGTRLTPWMLIVLATFAGGWLQTGTALAQKEEPIAPFVIDFRGAYMTYQATAALADTFGIEKSQLPSFGIGFEVGAHVYPVRGKSVALGVGTTLLFTQRSKKPFVAEGTSGDPNDPTVRTRVQGFSPQVSLNFGSRRGYSYVSAGIGRMGRTIVNTSGVMKASVPELTRVTTLNYGGGARWFSTSHVAFSFDLRFYKLNEQEATVRSAALPKQTLFVGSVGIAIH
jgi:hypothetical protein